MHENDERTAGALPVLRPGLECIPVRSDPRRVSVSEVYEEDPEIAESSDQDEQPPRMTLFDVMEKVGVFTGGLASLGIVCILGYIVIGIK